MTGNPPFTGACAVVTGASSGIGRALALELARRRARLALVARQSERLDTARKDCLAAGATQVEACPYDLNDVAGLGGLMNQIEQRLAAPIDLAIHAAGTVLIARVEDYPVDEAMRLLNVNLLAGFAMARALVPKMRSRGGTIGFISSGSAYRGLPYQWAYAASKAGVERLAEALRVEVAGSAIRVRVVSPGPVDTDMTSRPPTIAPATMVSGAQNAPAPDKMAPALLAAFAGGRARTELAMRVRIARWLSAFGAEPFDTILKRKR
jgi:short-subunit dehydrogenase